MDDVDCDVSESSLAECLHNGWNRHNCGHVEDVAIECAFPSTTIGTETMSRIVRNTATYMYG